MADTATRVPHWRALQLDPTVPADGVDAGTCFEAVERRSEAADED